MLVVKDIIVIFRKINTILRKIIEGYLDSVPSLTFNKIKTLLNSIFFVFHIDFRR